MRAPLVRAKPGSAPPAAAVLILLAALGPACRSTPPEERPPTADGAREKAHFEALMADLTAARGDAGLDTGVLDAQAARYEAVVAWFEKGELTSGVQRFWAGATLVRSDEPSHLVLAESLGASAAMLGEPRGRLVEAEARDRMALILGEPQPFGTQMVYEPMLGQWRLYHVDPRTTDADREAMGLPSLATLKARAAARNDDPQTKRLRDDLVRPRSLIE